MAFYPLIKLRHKLYSFVAVICTLASFSVSADTVISITSGRGAPFVNADNTGFYDLIVKNMFERNGIEARVVLLPSERSLINANKGIDDGNIARIKGINKKYSNLIMVPEKIIDFEFVAFTKNRQFRVNNWEQLQQYNVTFINGWKVFEKKVKHYKSLVRARDSAQLFNLISNGRADIALYDLWSGLWWLKHNPDEIYYLKPPIASFQLYLYVHKKHKNLVPDLARALKSMKADGTYQKIYNQSLRSLLN